MIDKEIEVNGYVSHREWGIGRIAAIEDDGEWLLIDFPDRTRHRMSREIALRSLTRLPDDGLEVMLQNNSEAVLGWVNNAPLKLIAAALADTGRAGRPKDLQGQLENRVIKNVKWSTWWKRIQPLLKESPHFRIDKGTYTLVSEVRGIPEEMPDIPKKDTNKAKKSSSKMASIKDWISWLFTDVGDVDTAPPANAIPQAVSEILEVLPVEMVEKVGQRLVNGLGIVLQAKRAPSENMIRAWIFNIEQLSNRLIETPSSTSVQEILTALMRLISSFFGKPKHKRVEDKLVLMVSGLAQKDRSTMQGIADGISVSLGKGSKEVLQTLRQICDKLPDTDRKLLIGNVTFRLFQHDNPEQQNLLLKAINEKDRDYLFERLSLLSAEGQISVRNLTDAILNEWQERQKRRDNPSIQSLLVSAILLGDSGSSLMTIVTEEFRASIRKQGNTERNQILDLILRITREEISQAKRDVEQRLRKDIASLNEQLTEEKRGRERTKRAVDDLQTQLAKNREEAILEIRRDMLLVIGELMQLTSGKKNKPAEIIPDIEAGLSLALNAGDAEIYGQVGQMVAYDGKLHVAEGTVEQGDSVVIVVPGVIVRSHQTDNLILLKAHVAKKDK